ncbi:MAG TPA: hypothetical protein VGI95_18630 [Caulobacteraceae bacterium]|jgi:hypothetical protein
MRKLLLAGATASVLASCAEPALAAGLDTLPVVTPAPTDKVCGYATAAGHAAQCYTAPSIGATAVPGGSTNQFQYNCANAFCGSPTLIFDAVGSGGPVFLTNNQVQFRNGSTAWLSAVNNGAGGGTVTLTGASTLGWPSAGFAFDSGGLLDLGNGSASDHSASLNLSTMNAFTSVEVGPHSGFPYDNFTSTTASIYTDMRLVGGFVTNTAPSGQSNISQGAANSGQGLNFFGSSNGGQLNCDLLSSYCMARDVDFWAEDGFEVFGIESGASDHHGLELGMSRNPNSMQQVSQLLPLDRINAPGGVLHYNVTSGGVGYTSSPTATVSGTGCTEAPDVHPDVFIVSGAVVGVSRHYNPGYGCSTVAVSFSGGGGTGASATATLTSGATDASVGPDVLVLHGSGSTGDFAWAGFGQADLGYGRIRFGVTNDSGHAWDATVALQATLAVSAPIEWDTPLGSPGAGFSKDFRINDTGHLMSIENAAGSAQAGVKVGFVRMSPTTVSGLATADPTPVDGDTAYVTDAAAPTFNSTLSGGGSVHTNVHYDASASTWKAG